MGEFRVAQPIVMLLLRHRSSELLTMLMLQVEQYVKISGHWDLSKVNDMGTNLIREFIR